MQSRSFTVALLLLVAATRVAADVPAEPTGQIAALPQPPRAHWAWVADLVLERIALMDVDEDRFLGIVNGGYGPMLPLFPSRRAEIYLPSTYFSRRSHGDRTDVLEIYDPTTLALITEIPIPAKRATNAVALGHAALSDDDRFVAIFNWTTGTSLSIVDVEHRIFTGEIPTPGCSLAYSAGPRRFLTLCGDGAVLAITLDDDGHEASRTRTQPFFDPQTDPVTEKAVRYGDEWEFVSFDGKVHAIDVSQPEIRFGDPWWLQSDSERSSWRVGGLQHLAVHQRSRRLYALMHRGGADTHKDPGEEVWMYDLVSHQRVGRVKLVNPGLTIYGFPITVGRNWIWPFNGAFDWLLNTFAPAVVTAIQVTQDDAPLLLTASQFTGSIGVYDATSGAFLRRVQPTGWTSDILVAPWDGRGNK